MATVRFTGTFFVILYSILYTSSKFSAQATYISDLVSNLVEPNWIKGVLHKPHIIGGELADIKDFKYQVSLQKNGEGHICGGSVLDKKHVLTAAHCIEKRLPLLMYYIVANTTTLDTEAKNYKIEKIIPHHKYKPTERPAERYPSFDLAILKLQDEFVFDIFTNIQPVKIVETLKEPDEKTDVIVAGWGKYGGELFSSQLRKVALKIVGRQTCQKMFRDKKTCKESLQNLDLDSEVICARAEGTTKKDCAQGDSGGPLVDKNGVQVGIVSCGDGTQNLNCPGVYTNLAHPEINKFIKTNLN